MYKIISETSFAKDESATYTRQILAVCDESDDLTALGTDWYPLSVAVQCDPFKVYVMNASGEWKEKA